MAVLPKLTEQFFETSLRIVLHEAFVARTRRYDSGWRVLPYAMIAQFGEGGVSCERAGYESCTIAPGVAVVIPAGLSHRFHYPAGQITHPLRSCPLSAARNHRLAGAV